MDFPSKYYIPFLYLLLILALILMILKCHEGQLILSLALMYILSNKICTYLMLDR